MIKVTVVGSGDAFGSGGRKNSCILLEGRDSVVLLDCGASTLPELNGMGFPVNSITHIFNTHHHGDHFGGIPFLLLNDYYNAKRTIPLKIMTPEGGADKIRKMTDLLYPELHEKVAELPIEFVEYGSEYEDAGLSAQFYEVPHSEKLKCYGIRLQIEDKVIAFTGDTEWTDSIISLAYGSDLLIGECNLLKKGIPGHMDIDRWLNEQGRLNTDRLLLTHLGKDMIEAQDQYDIEFAYDGMTFEV